MTIESINQLYYINYPDKKIVTGDGNANAEIMLIGEAPGREEVEQGKPFVGKAGKNLAEFMQTLNITREQIFISNAVKFRPTKSSDCGRLSNRPPTLEEIQSFLPYLVKEIEVIDPKVLVTLGNTPLQALLGKSATIGRVHGQVQEYKGWKLFPLYHPACIIYNPSLKQVYQKDVLILKEYIAKL